MFEREEYDTDIANSGKKAIEYLTHKHPDGVILDLMLPEIDGIEVLKFIRGNKSTNDIPVLILTAKDLTKEDRKQLTSSSIQQLIYKGNIDKDDLIFNIELMLKNNMRQKSLIKNHVSEKLNTSQIEHPSEIISKEMSKREKKKLKKGTLY